MVLLIKIKNTPHPARDEAPWYHPYSFRRAPRKIKRNLSAVTGVPAADYRRKAVQLPLWSYTAVGWCVEEERFYVAAAKVDRNPQWRPEHYDDRKLDPLAASIKAHIVNEGAA